LAKQLRDAIERDLLTPECARLADFLGAWRTEVKGALPTYQQRMAFWEGVLDSQVPALLESDQPQRADQFMRALIAQAVEKSSCN
jgi:siroheme synthase (precorrin-2 oxidase/ferrochelatase)